jgi:hypothetical protein
MATMMMVGPIEVEAADAVVAALKGWRGAVEVRLAEIQVELDEIGPTFGMQGRRAELGREKDRLLDELLGLRSAAAEAVEAR